MSAELHRFLKPRQHILFQLT